MSTMFPGDAFPTYQITMSEIPLMEQTQRDSLEDGFCNPGQHELATISVTDPSKTNIFGLSASRTLIFCRKCPFHYFPEPPNEADEADNESEIAENGLQND